MAGSIIDGAVRVHGAMRRGAMVAIAVALACSACGQKQETTVATGPDGTKMTMTQDAGDNVATVNVTTGNGQTASFSAGGGTWPATAPAFAPAYPGAKIAGGFSGATDGKSAAMVSFETGDAPDTVVAFYRDKARAAGLKDETTVGSGGMKMYGAKTPDGGGFSVMARAESGKTTATVSYGSK